MRIALLSTHYENTGDDLIRYGVQHQIAGALGQEPRWSHVSKANRLSLLFPRSRWTHAPQSRMSDRARRVSSRVWELAQATRLGKFDKMRNAGAFVIAGTPLFYFIGGNDFVGIEHQYGDDWPNEILARLDLHPRVPCLALGIGSIYEGPPEEIAAKFPVAAGFMRRLLERTALLTTRDSNTDRLLRAVAPDCGSRILPSICPSFWAQKRLGILRCAPEKTVAVSYSIESANWDLSDSREHILTARQNAFETVIRHLCARGYAITLLAQNEYDVDAIGSLPRAPGLAVPRLSGAHRLVSTVANAHAVVTWRVHSAVAALAAGRPALLFGTDSRSSTAASLGALILDDRCATPGRIRDEIDLLLEEGCGDSAQRIAQADACRAAEFARIQAPLSSALT